MKVTSKLYNGHRLPVSIYNYAKKLEERLVEACKDVGSVIPIEDRVIKAIKRKKYLNKIQKKALKFLMHTETKEFNFDWDNDLYITDIIPKPEFSMGFVLVSGFQYTRNDLEFILNQPHSERPTIDMF